MQPHPRFEDVASFQHPSGVVIVVTKKVGESRHSFSILKTYGDGTKRTSFLNRRHVSAVRELLDQVEEWLDTQVEHDAAKRAVAAMTDAAAR